MDGKVDMLNYGRARLGTAARWYLGTMAFALPFLFSCQVMGTETANMPTDLLVWMVLGFTPSAPAFLATLLAGVGLMLVLCAYPRLPLGDGTLPWIGVWFAPFLAGLLGLVETTEWDYALNWLLHFWGAATYGLSVWWASRYDRNLLKFWCFCVSLGVLLLCAYGVYQRFGGFEKLLAEMKSQHLQEYGEPLPERIESKLRQLRVNSFFSDPNVFAAHLLVAFPVLGIWLLNMKELKKSHARPYVLGAVAVVFLVMLYFTGSRGAMMGLLAGGCLSIWALPGLQKKQWKWCLPILGLLGCLLIWWYASASLEKGQVSTATVRFGYYQVALRMFQDAPLTGKGLGEFYTHYVRFKPLEAEMTRDPHSFLLGSLAQCGILGGLAVVLAISFPFVEALRKTRWKRPKEGDGMVAESAWHVLPILALGAWAVHSCFQFNELIPGTLYLLPVIPLLGRDTGQDTKRKLHNVAWGTCPAALIAGSCILLPCCKIPAECRFQQVTEDLHFLRRDMVQGTAQNSSFLATDRQLVWQTQYRKIIRELNQISQCMPHAIGPDKLLLEVLQEQFLNSPDNAEIPVEDLELARKIGRQMIQRTPHRSVAFNDFAWVCLAGGQELEAKNALEKARLWYPGDFKSYVLNALPAGNLEALRAVHRLTGTVRDDSRGGVKVFLEKVNPENREKLKEWLKDAPGVRFIF